MMLGDSICTTLTRKIAYVSSSGFIQTNGNIAGTGKDGSVDMCTHLSNAVLHRLKAGIRNCLV